MIKAIIVIVAIFAVATFLSTILAGTTDYSLVQSTIGNITNPAGLVPHPSLDAPFIRIPWIDSVAQMVRMNGLIFHGTVGSYVLLFIVLFCGTWVSLKVFVWIAGLIRGSGGGD